jgi:hypothetical protein
MVKLPNRLRDAPARHGFGTRMLAQSNHVEFGASGSLVRLFPSLSFAGRVRWRNDHQVAHELVKDFMLTVTLFDLRQQAPAAAGAPKNDFDTSLAITWTY